MKQILFGLLILLALKSYAGPTEAIRAAVARSGSDISKIENISKSPMAGLYQVEIQGGRVIYASPDGRYLIQGYLYEALESGVRNLTVELETKGVAEIISKIPEAEMVIFPAHQPKTEITVFTDTECPFCHKLHEDIDELNKLGVSVRYLAYPRQGLKTKAYNILANVWCSEDRNEAMDNAIGGDEVEATECENPVAKQYELGRLLRVQGTPAIILQNGQIVTGYRPAGVLAEAAVQAAK